MSELSEYVRQLLEKGYSEQYIKKYLKGYGYSAKEIQKSISSVGGSSTIRHEHHVSGSSIMFIILVLVLMGGTVYSVLQLSGVIGKEALMDVEVEPRYTQTDAGGDIGFNLQLSNLGSKDKFDAVVLYEIMKGSEVVFTMEETFAVSTSAKRYKTLKAPSEPGDYRLRATAQYDGKEAVASFSFTVEGEVLDEPDEEEPSEGEGKPDGETTAKIDHVRDIASSQPSKAEGICLELQGTTMDDCLSIVVRESRRPEFCSNMQSTQTRDNCYMTFIIEGQTHLCSEIEMQSNRDYCDRVRDVQIMAKYYQDN